MSGELRGQRALVTGGGRGIGRTIATALAEAGAAVAITARSPEELASTRASIEETHPGCRVLTHVGDVTDPSAVEAAVAATEAELGPLDLLVNNAGAQVTPGPLWEADPAEWWRAHEVNVFGTFLFCRAVVPRMIARGGGRIVNVASRAGVVAIPHASGYFSSKTAQVRLSELLALETRCHGVWVFAIHPGPIKTRMNEKLLESPAGKKWFPNPREVLEPSADRAARLCVAIAAGKADVLTGRYIDVDDDLDALVACADQVWGKRLYTLHISKLGGVT